MDLKKAIADNNELGAAIFLTQLKQLGYKVIKIENKGDTPLSQLDSETDRLNLGL
jgi:hypothetical protein